MGSLKNYTELKKKELKVGTGLEDMTKRNLPTQQSL